MLTSKQRAYLKGIASTYETIFQIGKGAFFISEKVDPTGFVVLFTFCPNLPQKTRFLINRLSKRFKLLSHCVAKWAIKSKMKL